MPRDRVYTAPMVEPPRDPLLQERLLRTWKQWREKWKDSALRFPIRAFALVLAGGLLLKQAAAMASLEQIRTASEWTAVFTQSIVGLFTDRSSVSGQMLYLDGFSLRVIFECLGPYEMVIFSAVVLAYPTTWVARAWGLLLGPFVIYLFNIVRIIGLLLVGRFEPELFDFFHVYFWQGTLIAMVAVTWLGWMRLFVPR